VKAVTFKLDDKVLEKIDSLCSRLGVNRSALIRMAIMKFLDDYERAERQRRAGIKIYPATVTVSTPSPCVYRAELSCGHRVCREFTPYKLGENVYCPKCNKWSIVKKVYR